MSNCQYIWIEDNSPLYLEKKSNGAQFSTDEYLVCAWTYYIQHATMEERTADARELVMVEK